MRYLMPIILFLFISTVQAQINQPGRYEVEMDAFDNYFTLIPADQDGLIMVRATNETGPKGDVEWDFIKLDTSLNEEWKTKYYIDSKYHFTGYDYHRGFAYLLFNNGPYIKDNLTLLQIDLASKEPEYIEIPKDFAIELSEFEMVGESVILGGYVNYRPTVILYHLPSKKFKVLPGFYMNRSELLQIEIDDEKEIFRVITTARTLDKNNTINIKTFDKDGELMINLTLKPDRDINLLDGRSTGIHNNSQFVAGTYSQLRSARKGKESYSVGIYVARLDANGEQLINYYNYADMDNFFNYMKANKQKRIEKRIERRKIKGKEIKFNYRLLVHNIIERENGNYILLGEAYYPVYSNRDSNPYMRSFYQPGLSGFRYTHAVLFCFNHQGKHLWDNSFEINDVTSYVLEKYVHVDAMEDKLVLLYNFENVIRTKIIKGDEVVEGKSFNDIALKFDEDEAKEEDNEMGGLKSWYSDNFFAYGVQHIRNKYNDSVDHNRKVFYVNKINYQ